MTFRLQALLAALLVCALGCSGETGKLQNGYYTAEAQYFDEYGWKEYLSIYVNNGHIVTAEYNAKNPSGFIKSWDMDYMRQMNSIDKNYPTRYTRNYAGALVTLQDPSRIDAMSGATNSHRSFTLLAAAAIKRARAGDKRVAFVYIPGNEHGY